MFNKLIASQGGRSRTWSPRTATFSIAFHGLLLAGAVYATVGGPAEAAEVEEEVTFIEIEETEPEPPQPEVPPPPPPAETPVAPPPPQGFQELLPPTEPPPVIPDVDLSEPAVSAADFSGVGVAGGTADGVEGGTPQDVAVDSATFAYQPAVLEVQPKLNNLRDVQRALTRNYPRMLQDAGISGQTVMQFVITEQGTVDPSTVEVIQSSHEPFQDASTRVVEAFRFDPGIYQGRPVRVLIRMPITWQAR